MSNAIRVETVDPSPLPEGFSVQADWCWSVGQTFEDSSQSLDRISEATKMVVNAIQFAAGSFRITSLKVSSDFIERRGNPAKFNDHPPLVACVNHDWSSLLRLGSSPVWCADLNANAVALL